MATSRWFLVAVALATGCAGARDAVRPGDPPLYLATPEGGTVTVDALRSDRDATVLVFWTATCPCVRRYQARVDALLDTYPGDRVRVVGVSSNVGESYADVLRTAAERGVRIPVYRDEGGRVAQAYGARSTPTIVVVDRKGEVRFLGWLDNERLPGESGREPWLDRALQGVLDGRSSFSARTPTYGCTITRSLFDPNPSPCCSVPK
jgi:peroxiredoxin